MKIAFGHIKDNQTGQNAVKKLPRNCYCNPLNHCYCIMTSLSDYFVMNPDVIAKPDTALFCGQLT